MARTLVTLRGAGLAYGDAALLDGADLSISEGERIGLIGRNGTGKSSLMRILARLEKPDEGEVLFADGLRASYLAQESVIADAPSVREAVVQSGLVTLSEDEADKWREISRLDAYLQKFGMDPEAPFSGASGGQKKRAALAAALSKDFALLLLDEPTNHLDIDGILILEKILKNELGSQKALLCVTHDRRFLDALATRIVELDRGMLRSYPGNFAAYEEKKAYEMNEERLASRRFDKFWAQEEAWIRKGIEARRTRNEGRVRRLEALRRIRAERREAMGQISMSVSSGQKSGRIVSELEGVSKSFGGKCVVKDLSYTLLRGDRLGLIGPNGAGKTTLISLILGKIEPDAGKVRLGTNLQIAYYDQLRSGLDLDKTVAETISPGSDFIEIGGVKKHVMSYLSDFLFSPRRALSPVKSLSGGERNRLFLARLFALPANLIVLDEPTNDLDMDALEVLEETLASYKGTVILVSHDRAFLDNVVTEVLVSEGGGAWREFVGGYSDWERFESTRKKEAPVLEKRVQKTAPKAPQPPKKVRLSYKEAKALESLPEEIMEKEAQKDALLKEMQDASFYTESTAESIKEKTAGLESLEKEIEALYARWDELEAKKALSEKKSKG